MNLKETILNICREQTALKPVRIKEWNQTVYVKPLTAKLLLDMQENKDHSYPIRLVAACTCDEAGETLFTPSEVCDLTSDGFAELFTACNKQNDLSEEAVEEQKKS